MTKQKNDNPSPSRRDMLGLLGLAAGARFASPLIEQLTLAAELGQPAGTTALRIPAGAIVRTVLQDVSPAVLRGRATLMHEHLLGGFYSSPPRPAPPAAPAGRGGESRGASPGNPALREDSPESLGLIVEELEASKKDGLGAIVDAAIYRRSAEMVANLKTLASRSGVHIIAGGGYYRAPYPPGVIDRSEEQIADEFVQDAQAQRWGAFGEIGSSLETHPDERKMMRAVALAHRRTGLPIFTHSPHESCQACAREQLEIYEAQGVDPHHLCIGHLSDLKDDPRAETPKAIAKRGGFVGFDTVGHELGVSRTTLVTDKMKLGMLLEVLEAGYEDHVLLSSDMAHNNHLKANWGDGFSAVLIAFGAKMRNAGVKEPIIRKILHDNPTRFLAFVPKSDARG